MSEEMQKDTKQLKDIKTREDLKAYLHSIKGTKTESALVKESGIQRDFLRRVDGDNDAQKSWVTEERAYALCRFIAPYEKKTVKEVLDILIENGLLPNKIKPDTKMFEEDDQQEETEKNDADIEKFEEDDQQEVSEKNDADIKYIEGLTACVKGIIENMHFRIKEKEWKFKSNLKFQTIGVEKNSILLAGIETWESVELAYMCTDTSDKDFEQIYEILQTHCKDRKILFLILCKGSHVYEKVYGDIKMLKLENSILLINLDKSKEALIMSMHNKHRKAFNYEKEFASCKEEILSFME